jgi:transformation/transcription domain-associated protein
MKKEILVEFLRLFQSKELTQNQLVIAMQMLILPMLVHAFQNGQNRDVVDSSIIETIVEKFLNPPGKVSSLC